jgi:hypothetical protein
MSKLNSKVLKTVPVFESEARRNRYYYQHETDALNASLKAGDQIDGFIRNIVQDLRPRDPITGQVIPAKRNRK